MAGVTMSIVIIREGACRRGSVAATPSRKIRPHRIRLAAPSIDALHLGITRGTGILAQAVNRLDNLLIQLQTHFWPEPTSDEPDLETLEAWMWDGCCEATDGCLVEPDGKCVHGHPSWLLRMGLI